MLKITIRNLQNQRRIELAGRLVGPWVAELQSTCESLLADTPEPVDLDLAQVSYVDHAGLQLLLKLQGIRVRFHNCSGFLTQQLKSAPYLNIA